MIALLGLFLISCGCLVAYVVIKDRRRQRRIRRYAAHLHRVYLKTRRYEQVVAWLFAHRKQLRLEHRPRVSRDVPKPRLVPFDESANDPAGKSSARLEPTEQIAAE